MESPTTVERTLEPFHDGLTRTDLDSATLIRFDSINLGRVLTEMPVRPTDLSIGPRDIVVADLSSQSVLRYDRDGRFVARYTRVGYIPLEQPYRVIRIGDSTFVLDLTGPVRVSRLASAGTLAVVDSGVDNAIDVAMANGMILYGRTMFEPSEATKGLIEARSPLGGARWQACPANPTLEASVKRRGAIGAHQTTQVVVSGNTVYCAQPSSPSIQMYGLTGTYRGRFDRVPPLYRSPEDTPMSVSGIRQLQASWMPISGMWPWSTGMAVRHIVRDTIADRFRDFLFVCDSAQGPTHCTYSEMPFHVVSFSPPDTAWAVDNSNRSGPRLVGFRIVRRNRR